MPLVPKVLELNRRLNNHIDDTIIPLIVEALIEARDDSTLRYGNLGDTNSRRITYLIDYCQDHCCMNQLIDALDAIDPTILSGSDQSLDAAWSDWAKAYDASHSKVNPPAPPLANRSSSGMVAPNQADPQTSASANNITDNTGNTVPSSGTAQRNAGRDQNSDNRNVSIGSGPINDYGGVQGGLTIINNFGGMSGSISSSNVPPPLASSEQGDLNPIELQQAAAFVSQLHIFGAAADLYSRALALANRGRFAEMVDYCQRAISASKAVGDLNAQLNILADLARAYAQLGQYDQSLAAYQQAITLAMQIGNPRAAAMAWFELGNIWAMRGQTQQALFSLGQAYNIFTTFGDWGSANICMIRAAALSPSLPLW